MQAMWRGVLSHLSQTSINYKENYNLNNNVLFFNIIVKSH